LTHPLGRSPPGRGVSRGFELHAASLRTTVRMQAHWLARMAELFPAPLINANPQIPDWG
jgi:hypothetical protein